MATVTRQIGSFDNGNVSFSIDYDDTTLIVLSFSCVNNSTQNAWGKATRISTGRSYEKVFLPGSITIFIPTNTAQRLELFIDPVKNALDGVDFQLMFPYV